MGIEGLSKEEEGAVLGALDRSYAIIAFTPDGTILGANAAFLTTMGYTADEVRGKHHRIFMDSAEAATPEYSEFWASLGRGEQQVREFRRKHKDGSDVWISASYTPLVVDGRVTKVIKLCTNVTERKVAVDAIGEALIQLVSGHPQARLGPEVTGDFAEFRQMFNTAADSYEDALRPLIELSDHLSGLSDHIERSAEDLASQTEEQTQAIGSLSATLNTVADESDQVQAKANEADSQAKAAATKAERGAEIVQQTIDAIGKIEAITDEVTDTIKVIESFAFQTNLLALNAGVEAARAGDAGRGFAVVATEVRSLAQRSAEASKTISDLTRRVEQTVAEGAKFAASAGEALTEIDHSVENVVSATTMIAEVSQSQTTSIQGVNDTVRSFDRSFQRLANLAVDGKSQATNLREQSGSLQGAVARLDHSSERSGRASAGMSRNRA